MAETKVPRRSVVAQIAELLESPEIVEFMRELDDLRWTGRRGYGSRALVGAALVKSLYNVPTWTRTVGLVSEHDALRDVLGTCPSVYACYRFCEKLRKNAPTLAKCLDGLVTSLKCEIPGFGTD